MDERVTYYVDVVLPLHLPQYYTYRVPFEYNDAILVGQRVVVQFGGSKVYSAVVRNVHRQAPDHANVKYILGILDPQPVVTELQLQFWEWIAQYYMCCVGDVMAVALPSAYRLQSESFVEVHPDFSGEISNLSQNEIKILELLSTNGTAKVSDITKAVNIQKIMPLLKTMIEKKIIIMDEELKQRYTPKIETYLKLSPEYLEADKGRQLFDSLEGKASSHKQLEVMLKFMQQTDFGKQSIRKSIFTRDKDLSLSSLKILIKNGVIVAYGQQESRLIDVDKTQSVNTIKLSDQQQKAFEKIDINNPEAPQITLVHGVTSSGKTELYIKLINEVVKQGKGPKARFGDVVRFDYRGYNMITGELFDQTYGQRDPIDHVLGKPMFAGLIEGMQLMNAGSLYRLYVPSALAFGANGTQNIPPYTPVIYEIELHAINPE